MEGGGGWRGVTVLVPVGEYIDGRYARESHGVSQSDTGSAILTRTTRSILFLPRRYRCVTPFPMILKLVLRITISTGIVQHSTVHCFCFMRSLPASLLRPPTRVHTAECTEKWQQLEHQYASW